MSIKQKAQALVLTIFIILVSLGVVIVLLMPINQQVIKVRKILDSFQALSNAETGLEVSNFYAIKGDTLSGYSFQTSTVPYPGSDCENFVNNMDRIMCRGNPNCGSRAEGIIPPNDCDITRINKDIDNSINSTIYEAVFKRNYDYYPYTKIISTGRLKNIERALDFDSWPF
ncbi:MAG: hypothetical protein C4348_00505 [Patescibacteria group bacterium]